MKNETVYLSCAETAALVRKALKESFPEIKFGVRSKTYSMGASITVSWTDGPNNKQVDAVIQRFSGASFDGSIDLKSYHRSVLDGREVHFGADFIFTNREHSDGVIGRTIASEMRRYLGEELLTVGEAVQKFRSGGLYQLPVAGVKGWDAHWNLQAVVLRALSKRSDRLSVTQSPTAMSVQ